MEGAIISRERFLGLEGIVHMATGGESPVLLAARDAMVEFCELKSQGMTGRDRIIETYAETKELVARFLGAPGGAEDIAFLNHAADGFNVLGRGLAWRDGDEVISIRNEYPSSLLPWLARRQLGVRLVAVEPGTDTEAAIEAAMTTRTRLICVSYVSYLTGMRLDLARLAATAHARGALLAVDVSHALGVLRIPTELCDVLVSCCYKFMLATHGVGIFCWNRRRIAELTQPSVGWYSVEWPSVDERAEHYTLKDGAARFELGNPAFVAIFALNQAIKVLSDTGVERLEPHVLDLGAELLEGLPKLGLNAWTPRPPNRRGPNIVFGSDDPEGVVQRLAQRGILAWGSEGRVRLSLHGFNGSADVHAALSGLASAT